MNHFLQRVNKPKLSFLYVFIFASSLFVLTGCIKEPHKPVLKISTLASGLSNPIGLEIDKSGRVLAVEGGTGKNDGKVVAITPDGRKQDVITNFESIIFEGTEPDGPSHLMFADGLLYILGRGGKMYKANASALTPGAAPIKASSLGVENIGAYVLGQGFLDSHPYNFTVGPDGAIYITDAGANAIIRREKTGALSIFAKIPGVANPTPVGPPQVESVPTGIIYDGQKFLVTTLTGFPFPQGKAGIYKISTSGAVSVYQDGFTTLVDIAHGSSLGRLVLEHGLFGAMGFTPNTGRLVWADGTKATSLADGLNVPAGLKQLNEHTWYVTSLGDGSVLKVTYQ